MKTRLAIGIPNSGTMKTQTVFSLCRALKNFPHEYQLIFKEGSILHANREVIVQKAIDLGCTHLLFLDSDMMFEEDAIARVLARNKEIIGVHYNTRKFPTQSTVNFSVKSPKKLQKVHSVATGFMLINLAVFSTLKHPWFFWESDENGGVKTGEDMWFCDRAREAGFEVWVDLGIPVGHIGDHIF